MATGDIYQVVVAFTSGASGKGLSFTINGLQNDLTAPTMSAIGDDVKAWWDTGVGGGAAYKSYCPDETSLTEVTLRRMDPLEPLIQSYTTDLPIAGTSAGDPYAPSVATLVSIRTPNIGKSYRGRIYLPGVSESFVGTNGTISAVDAEDIAEGIAGLFSSFTVDDLSPCVWSRTLGIGTEWSQVYVDRVLRTQRRRQDRTAVYVAP